MDSKRGARILAKLVKRQRGKCSYCQRSIFIPANRGPGGHRDDEATLDHVLPRAQGWTTVGNLVACCHVCNNAKGPLDGKTFRRLRDNPEELRKARRAKNMEIEAINKPVYARAATPESSG